MDNFYGKDHVQQKNILSLGDSENELHALLSVTRGVPNCCGKSLKFIEAPSIEQLLEQHDFLADCLIDLIEHNGDLDVEIGKEGA